HDGADPRHRGAEHVALRQLHELRRPVGHELVETRALLGRGAHGLTTSSSSPVSSPDSLALPGARSGGAAPSVSTPSPAGYSAPDLTKTRLPSFPCPRAG